MTDTNYLYQYFLEKSPDDKSEDTVYSAESFEHTGSKEEDDE